MLEHTSLASSHKLKSMKNAILLLLTILVPPMVAAYQLTPTFLRKASVATAIALVPLASQAADDRGAQLFQANCAGCHAGGMNFVAEKKTLQKDALEKFGRLDADTMLNFVQNGMPHKLLPFNKLPTEDFVAMTTFVREQALNDRW